MFGVLNHNIKKIPFKISNQIPKIIKSFLYLFILLTWGVIILGTLQNFI